MRVGILAEKLGMSRYYDENSSNQAVTLLDRCNIELDNFLKDLKDEKSRSKLLSINEKSQNIKQLQ